MEEILHQLRLVVYPIIYRVSYMLGGVWDFIHQQYECVQPVPFHRLSDLQLGDQEATLNHLVDVTFTGVHHKHLVTWENQP